MRHIFLRHIFFHIQFHKSSLLHQSYNIPSRLTKEKKTNNVVPGQFKFEILCVCASGLLSFFSSVNKFCFGYSLMCILKSIICPMCIHVFFVPEGSFPLFHLRERNSHWLSREIESDLASRIQSSQDIILYSFFSCSFPGFLLCIHCFSLQKWRALWGYSLPQVFDHKKIKGEKESILSYHSLQSRPSLSHLITTLLFPFILFRIPCPTPFKRKSTGTVCLKAP